MPDIKLKAIETGYNGYKFRSRIEARWAVFFDALGVEYEYEVEGYDLGALGYYLPDFEITCGAAKAIIEIKRGISQTNKIASVDPRAAKKCCKLSLMSPGVFVILIFGDPLNHKSVWFLDGVVEYPCTAIGFYAGDEISPTHWDGYIVIEGYPAMIYIHKDEAIKARQARFEHGETPHAY